MESINVVLTVELLAVALNLAFIVFVWRCRGTISDFLQLMLLGLAFMNLLTNTQNIVFDVISPPGAQQSWSMCFTFFINSAFFNYATLMLVASINIARIAAVKWPHRYKLYFTRRKAVKIVVCICAVSIILSLISLPDLLKLYSHSPTSCDFVKIYRNRFATSVLCAISIFLLAAVDVLLLVNVWELVKYYKKKVAYTNNIPPANVLVAARKILVSSRIAVASALLYSWSIGFTVSGYLWVSVTNCDDKSLLEHAMPVAVAFMQVTLTLQDPLVYFISIVKWSSVREFLCKSCEVKFGANQVMPITPIEMQGPTRSGRGDACAGENQSGLLETFQVRGLSMPLQTRETFV